MVRGPSNRKEASCKTVVPGSAGFNVNWQSLLSKNHSLRSVLIARRAGKCRIEYAMRINQLQGYMLEKMYGISYRDH
jgi:hypothetical protein